jgi:hypothetical protein
LISRDLFPCMGNVHVASGWTRIPATFLLSNVSLTHRAIPAELKLYLGEQLTDYSSYLPSRFIQEPRTTEGFLPKLRCHPLAALTSKKRSEGRSVEEDEKKIQEEGYIQRGGYNMGRDLYPKVMTGNGRWVYKTEQEEPSKKKPNETNRDQAGSR